MSKEIGHNFEMEAQVDADFLKNTFVDGFTITREKFDAMLKNHTGRSLDEAFPNTSVMSVMEYGGSFYVLGYYDNPNTGNFTFNIMSMESDNSGMPQEWLMDVGYAQCHTLLMMVADMYRALNDYRLWTHVKGESAENTMLGVTALMLNLRKNMLENLVYGNSYNRNLPMLLDSLENNLKEQALPFINVYRIVMRFLQRQYYILTNLIDAIGDDEMLVQAKGLKDFTNTMMGRMIVIKNRIVGRGLVESEKIPAEMLLVSADVLIAKEAARNAGGQPPATFSNLDSHSEFADPAPEPEVKKPSPISIMMPTPPGIH